MKINPKCEKCKEKCKQSFGTIVVHCPNYKPKVVRHEQIKSTENTR